MQICYILLICIFAIHLIHILAILLIHILAILLIPILGNTPNTHFGNTATTHFGNTPNTHFGNTANTHFGNTANTHFGNAWWYCIRKRFAASIPGRLEWEVTLKATTAAEAENAILRQHKQASECIVSLKHKQEMDPGVVYNCPTGKRAKGGGGWGSYNLQFALLCYF